MMQSKGLPYKRKIDKKSITMDNLPILIVSLQYS